MKMIKSTIYFCVAVINSEAFAVSPLLPHDKNPCGIANRAMRRFVKIIQMLNNPPESELGKNSASPGTAVCSPNISSGEGDSPEVKALSKGDSPQPMLFCPPRNEARGSPSISLSGSPQKPTVCLSLCNSPDKFGSSSSGTESTERLLVLKPDSERAHDWRRNSEECISSESEDSRESSGSSSQSTDSIFSSTEKEKS
ncbi:MAG: hypothetical protein K6C34_04260 [Alphaproteobacteria bacterium]|nr:hypothetical protein [Alphaproteobacteria bacterium]